MADKSSRGILEVICGPMFSGKSEELIRRLRRARIANQVTLVFKPTIDNRKTLEHIHAHSGDKLQAIAVESPSELRELIVPEIAVIGIDEVQFFSEDIINVIIEFVHSGKRVIVAGLDRDFRGLPFGYMPALLAMADKLSKLTAVCIVCGNDAYLTQRLVNGEPAKVTDPIVMVGAQECYQARCGNCYQIDQVPWLLYVQK